MLRSFFATELPEMWNREAWPELCDNMEQVTLDSSNAFDKRLGDPDEMGDILGIFESVDPRINTQVVRLAQDRISEGDGRVIVSKMISGSLFVDWQLPVPDLMRAALDDSTALDASTLPARFRLPLAFKGAAHLLTAEDAALAATYLQLAEQDLQRQAARIVNPWWRTQTAGDPNYSNSR